MRILIVLLLTSISYSAFSQGLEFHINNDGEVTFSFDSLFIKKKNIKSIDYSFSSKKPKHIIQQDYQSYKTLHFNRMGLITEKKSEESISNITIKKHELSSYQNGKLVKLTQKDHIGYYSNFYEYSGDTTKISTYRASHYEPNISHSQDSTFISSQLFISTPSEVRELNQKGIEINKTSAFLDSIGLLQRELTEYTFSPNRIERSYSYNIEGLLSELKIASIQGTKEFKFKYDKLKSIELIEYYLNEKLVTEYEVVYNSEGWVSAFLENKINLGFLRIIKLDYTLF